MSVDPSWVMLGAVIAGGLLGLFQIPVWQGCAMAGIIVGRVLTTWGQNLAINWADRLSVMVRFALRGGLTADDPGAVLTSVRQLPSLSATDQGRLNFILALFSLPVILMYLVGRWRFRERPTALGPFSIYPVSFRRRLMASGLGAINGYLIARFLVPLLFPKANTVITVASGPVVSLLDENLVLVLTGFVLILIVYGLQASGRSRS